MINFVHDEEMQNVCGIKCASEAELRFHSILAHSDAKPSNCIPVFEKEPESFRDQLILAIARNLITVPEVHTALANGTVGSMAATIVGLADLILEKRSVAK